MLAVIPNPIFIARFNALVESPIYTGQETQGLEEGLHFYTRAKQEAGIKVLEDVDLSHRDVPLNDALQALKRFTEDYNRGLPEGVWIQGGTYVQTVDSIDARSYQKIFPVAQKFLQMNLETFFPAGTPSLAKERVTAIHNAAYIFVHGYSKQDTDAQGYLRCAIDEKKTVHVTPWVQV
jgi:hypothetical protein